MKLIDYNDMPSRNVIWYFSTNRSYPYIARKDFSDDTFFSRNIAENEVIDITNRVIDLFNMNNSDSFVFGYLPEPYYGPQQMFVADEKYLFIFNEEFECDTVFEKRILESKLRMELKSNNNKTRRTKI
ncbi:MULTISPECIES: hypothetical protein [Burkholderiaceae]|uniref:Uncharacterized protein n=1 Tax=Ralstonia mannitolilytica TaxID=105219 RepID=A0AAD2ENC6_9RALS|nr:MULTISPECIES: hypothetical protein [Burkholderiaceae]CAJ0694541.1 hypothetical protein R77591_04268 [Ralstonia mannitolilytica]